MKSNIPNINELPVLNDFISNDKIIIERSGQVQLLDYDQILVTANQITFSSDLINDTAQVAELSSYANEKFEELKVAINRPVDTKTITMLVDYTNTTNNQGTENTTDYKEVISTQDGEFSGPNNLVSFDTSIINDINVGEGTTRIVECDGERIIFGKGTISIPKGSYKIQTNITLSPDVEADFSALSDDCKDPFSDYINKRQQLWAYLSFNQLTTPSRVILNGSGGTTFNVVGNSINIGLNGYFYTDSTKVFGVKVHSLGKLYSGVVSKTYDQDTTDETNTQDNASISSFLQRNQFTQAQIILEKIATENVLNPLEDSPKDRLLQPHIKNTLQVPLIYEAGWFQKINVPDCADIPSTRFTTISTLPFRLDGENIYVGEYRGYVTEPGARGGFIKIGDNVRYVNYTRSFGSLPEIKSKHDIRDPILKKFDTPGWYGLITSSKAKIGEQYDTIFRIDKNNVVTQRVYVNQKEECPVDTVLPIVVVEQSRNQITATGSWTYFMGQQNLRPDTPNGQASPALYSTLNNPYINYEDESYILPANRLSPEGMQFLYLKQDGWASSLADGPAGPVANGQPQNDYIQTQGNPDQIFIIPTGVNFINACCVGGGGGTSILPFGEIPYINESYNREQAIAKPSYLTQLALDGAVSNGTANPPIIGEKFVLHRVNTDWTRYGTGGDGGDLVWGNFIPVKSGDIVLIKPGKAGGVSKGRDKVGCAGGDSELYINGKLIMVAAGGGSNTVSRVNGNFPHKINYGGSGQDPFFIDHREHIQQLDVPCRFDRAKISNRWYVKFFGGAGGGAAGFLGNGGDGGRFAPGESGKGTDGKGGGGGGGAASFSWSTVNSLSSTKSFLQIFDMINGGGRAPVTASFKNTYTGGSPEEYKTAVQGLNSRNQWSCEPECADQVAVTLDSRIHLCSKFPDGWPLTTRGKSQEYGPVHIVKDYNYRLLGIRWCKINTGLTIDDDYIIHPAMWKLGAGAAGGTWPWLKGTAYTTEFTNYNGNPIDPDIAGTSEAEYAVSNFSTAGPGMVRVTWGPSTTFPYELPEEPNFSENPIISVMV